METPTQLAAELGPLIASVLLLAAVSGLQWLQAKLKNRNKAKAETNGFVSALQLDERIDEFVTELRVLLGADRVHFSQPHNGTHFASMYPMYKLSRTHESCALGVDYRRKELSQVRVSEITYLVSPVLIGTIFEGAEQFCQGTSGEARVIGFNTDKFGPVYERFFLESMNVRYSISTAVWVDGELYGFVGVDFCKEDSCTRWDNTEWRCHVTEEIRSAAERIGYVIKEGKKKIKA